MLRSSSRFLVLLLIAAVIGSGFHANAALPLIEVSISPEARVKVAEGGALRELVQGEWCEFSLNIDNAAGLTSALRIESDNLLPVPPSKPGRDQWLRAELVPDGPLSGKRAETRKLRLWTDHSGVRSAVLNFNAGQGTQDLGFRSDVLLNFKIKPAASDKEAARREALDWFRLFTRLPYEAPCELQEEMLDLSLAVYRGWIVQPDADPAKTAAWLGKLRDLGKRTRAILGATRVEWRGDSLAITDAAPIALTDGLKRAVLLEVANRSAEPALLVPVWSGWKGTVAEGIDLQPGETRLTWASLEVADPSVKEATLTLVRQNVAPEIRQQAKAAVSVVPPAILKGRLIENSTGEVFPGRIHALGGDGVLRHGKAFADNPTLSEKPHVPLMFAGHPANIKLPFFYSDGTFEVAVAPGRVKVTLERGFEHPFVTETLDLKPGETREITLGSQRFLDMKPLGWISGDTHIHWAKNWWSEDEDLQLLKMVQRAEDLRVANNLTLKHHTTDQNFISPKQHPMGPIPGLCDGDYHAQMAEEYRNEEFYGHIIFLNIKRLIEPISTGFMGGPPFWDWPHNLPAIKEARAQGGISIEAHGLGRNNDVPVNVAQGFSDSLDQLEPDDYYRFLDCGFRVPLSNGSDHPARVSGVCRVYVKTDMPFTYERWIDGFRKNRTFTTSGPLLFLTVNGRDIGEVLDVKAGTPLKIKARAVSRNPIGVLQVISNGKMLAERQSTEREAEIEIDHIAGEPLWIVARASRGESFNALNGPDIAHTSAVYVNVDGRERFKREAAEEWIRRMEIHAADMEKNGRFPTDENRAEAVGHVRAGIHVYQKLIAANADKTTSAVDSSWQNLPVRLANGGGFGDGAGDRPELQETQARAFNCGLRFQIKGPELGITANGKPPGEVFKTDGGPLQVHLTGDPGSKHEARSIELIRNGRAEVFELPALVTINESGWFALRAIADGESAVRPAMTAPWYVELGGVAMKPRKEDAEFFLGWTERRMEQVKDSVPETELLKSALAFWRGKVAGAQPLTRVRGRILDAQTGKALPARIHIQAENGSWFFPESEGGQAVRYQKRNWRNPLSEEHHTTLGAQPWTADLPPGRYTITVERGTEWRPLERHIDVGSESLNLDLPLERWVDMAAESWFSGDTHVHRTLAELPNVMLAEDLNVTFPLTFWGRHGGEAPLRSDPGDDPGKTAELIRVDYTHVIWPRNTEWEIFSIGGHDHTLGAVFALGHHTPLEIGTPPLKPVVEAARAQGALFDMDKPDWPWSFALPPVMDIDLYELSNNHLWRAPFALNRWFTPAPEWMLPGATHEGDERDWIEYTHQSYWALLNCGRRLQPTAGTASGVHPVPLGFSRVYVHCPDGFSYDNWRAGLKAGRSFVTTGPMCQADIRRDGANARIEAKVRGSHPIGNVEVIVNGRVHETIAVRSREAHIERVIPLDGTSWLALRVWEPREDGRFRFAHSAPVWFDDPAKPLRPRPEQAAFLAQRVRDEISRSREMLPAAAIEEYEQALSEWERFMEADSIQSKR